jgi:protein-S-isoprenylcysteine O-methyltransferase Ste14
MSDPAASGAPSSSLLSRTGAFFFRHRDLLSPAVLVFLLTVTRPRLPLGSERWDAVLDVVGILTAATGQALRVAVIGYAYIVRGGKGRRVHASALVTGGLFAVSRNPLYLGNLLIYGGLLLVWNSPFMYLIAVPFYLFLYRAIVATEEEFLGAKFGAAYERYRDDVPRWIPALDRLPRALGEMSFNWRRVVLKDYGTVAAWTLTACLLLMLEALRFRGVAGARDALVPLAATMAGIVALWALARWLKLTRRLRA